MKKLFAALALVCLLSGGAVLGGEKFVLRVGFETPRTDSQYVGASYMAKLVNERSGGRIELKLFPDSVLGNGQAMISQVRGGTLDIYLGGSANFANFAKKLNILDIPFLFLGPKHVDVVLEGDFGRTMLGELDPFDMKGLAFWENGFRCLTNSKREVKKADDVKGLKLRTLSNPMHILAWELLGTNPVPMPLAELFTAMETKTVEGQEHPINVTYSAKLYEVQKYLSVSNHAYSPLIMVMNDKKFASMPEDLQKILVECAIEGGRHQKKFIRDNIAGYIKKIADYGCVITPADQMDMKSFSDVVGEKTRAMYLKDYGGDTGAEWLKKIDDASIEG